MVEGETGGGGGGEGGAGAEGDAEGGVGVGGVEVFEDVLKLLGLP